MTDAEVWVKWQAGRTNPSGSFYRFSYDATSLLKTKGENLLEVKVAKQSANKSVNAAERRADWWLYGGIYRPVWLEVVPAVSMEHFILDARADGSLRASVRTTGNAEGHVLAVSIRGLERRSFMDTARQRAGQLSACHLRQRNRVYMQMVGCKSTEYRSSGTLCGASGTERPQRKRYSGS